MSTETNSAIVRRFFEQVYNPRNLSVMEEILAPDIVNHTAEVFGLEGVKRVAAAVIAAYPVLHVTLEDVIAEGDKVAVRGADHFTHQLDGRQVTLPFRERRASLLLWR